MSNTNRNHLISRDAVKAFIASHPGAKQDGVALMAWCRVTERSAWRDFADVRETFQSVDKVQNVYVFNVGGNKYRIIARITFRAERPATVFVRFVGTHAEYDRVDFGAI
ncbi:type II toxin-antitoxin system HigB family toxin [Singulisphaera rosea]